VLHTWSECCWDLNWFSFWPQTTVERANTSEGDRGVRMIRTGYFSVLMPVVGLLEASLSLKGDV
jgi:hypothetical protein